MWQLHALTQWSVRREEEAPAPRERWLILALVAIACSARCIQVGYSFDTDEVFSVSLASQSLRDLIDGALWDRSHPPLHILLLHYWLKLFGTSETSARALSIACFGGLLLAGHAVVRRMTTPLWAGIVVLFVAVSPFFEYYGQQARPYALIAALGALNLLLFMRAMESPGSRGRWLAWALGGAALVWAQYMGVLLLGAECFIALLCLRWRAVLPIALCALAVLTVLPWAWAAMGGKVEAGGDPLDLIAWMAIPSTQDLAWYFVAVFGEGPLLRARWLLVIALPVVVAGTALLFWRGRLDPPRLLLLLAAVGMPVGLFVLSHAAHQPIFAARQLINAAFCFLAVFVLCAAALPRAIGWAALAVMLACMTSAFTTVFPVTRNPPWPAIAAHLDDTLGGASVRSVEPWITDPLLFYRRRGPVFGSTSMTGGTNGDSALVLCRPERCPLDRFGHDFQLRKTWTWGHGVVRELRLYERTP